MYLQVLRQYCVCACSGQYLVGMRVYSCSHTVY